LTYRIILFSYAERLNLRAAHEYKYLNQSDCMTVGGIDDAKKFHQLKVYYLTMCLVYNKHSDFISGLFKSMSFFSFCICNYRRKHLMLFEFLKRTKTWSLRCLLQYYGWEIYHSKLLTVKITLRLWVMKVRYIVGCISFDGLFAPHAVYANLVSLNS
jgi:hypothetical protein